MPLVRETKATLGDVLETSLRALHPLMPYVTEELWQRMPKPTPHAVSVAPRRVPAGDERARDADIEKRVALLQSVIGAARTIRSEHEVKPAAEVPLRVRVDDEADARVARECAPLIEFLVKTKDAPVFETVGRSARGGDDGGRRAARGGVDPGPGRPEGHREAEEEAARIERDDQADRQGHRQPSTRSSRAKGFVDRAPKEVVEETQAQRRSFVDARARIEEAKGLIGELDETKT